MLTIFRIHTNPVSSTRKTRSRIICRPYVADPYEHLQSYHAVDIGLDTFPYCGTTTSCEALWMGVPVVTLTGKRHVERVGFSLMNQLGLTELCASDIEEYISIAIDLSSKLNLLQSYRSQMRNRMLRSPLCDETRIARTLEKVYREELDKISSE